jgi:ABC toxin-like protein/neuraminidase-like protein
MRFEHEGRSLWYGTPDAPAPESAVSADTEVNITVGVHPVDSSNRVEILYRVNQGAVETAGAGWLRTDPSGKAQYFRGQLPGFRSGDLVEYLPVCRCAGRQVPSPDDALQFHSAFRVADAGAIPEPDPARAAINLRTIDSPARSNSSASDFMALPKQPVSPLRPRPDSDGEEPVPDEGGAVPVDNNPPNQPPDPPPAPAPFVVQGQVHYANGKGLVRGVVRAFHQGLRSEKLLGEAITDGSGRYQISFSSEQFGLVRQTNAALVTRAFDAGGSLLASSQPLFNAKPVETVNLVISGEYRGPSEYERIVQELTPHLQGLSFADLTENDERQDITYLANKTGWDARAVAMASLADQFSQRAVNAVPAANLPPAFFYALFRAGLPANEERLYQTAAGTAPAILNKAVDQGVIPASLTPAIPQMVAQFQTLSAQKLLTGPALAGASSLKEMLAVSRLDDRQQQKFAELYAGRQTDLPKFWNAVKDAFGQQTADRLQVDGKLGFLTINNAPLIQQLHTMAGGGGLSDPLQLAQLGYHRPEKWTALLTADISIPEDIPGETPEAKRANYAEYLAAKVRVSYPTASVAQMIKSGDLPLPGAKPGVSDQVHAFLTEHQDFEIGAQPVQQYIAQKKLQVPELQVPDETVKQVKRVQRLYQITTSDQAMTGLMKRGIDAAHHVVRYDRETFIQSFAEDMGGADNAAQTYDKSAHVHNAVLNIAIGYLTARNGVGLGAQPLKAVQQSSGAARQILQPAPKGSIAEISALADVIAYPTLEGLFGEMDFCACDHCRSILSPAAYLVDLLLFMGSDEQAWADFLANWRSNHNGAPYPFPNQAAWADYQNDWNARHPGQPIPNTEMAPLDVLLSRRPDIQHLPLTCENTNTTLPYIDVVNETLEYFVANNVQQLSLNGYAGHDTGGADSADLMASPQFVMDSAYAKLKSERFPSPLPFHQPLERLRRYFNKFEVPLPLAMERLRKSDDLERGANPYGWRDILMEELRLSRDEYEILTDSNAVPLWRMYGFPNGTADAAVVAVLSNAKQFTRRVGITYDEIVAILKTRFVNPNSYLIPKLERLGVPFATLKALKDGTISNADFDALLPQGAAAPDPAAYGGDIKAWVKNNANFSRIMELIILADPTGSLDPCSFDNLEFRYSKPMAGAGDTSTRLGAVEFVRLLRFIRLWKKMGWTIEQTDAAICSLYREDMSPLGADDVNTVAELDAGFSALLLRVGIIIRVMSALNLTPNRDLMQLLACWSEIGAHGDSALYRQMFLNPAILKQDAVFADNGYGEFLVNETIKLADHAEALRSAFNLTGDEYDQIIRGLGYNTITPLTIPKLSAIFRQAYLARKLKISVRELLLLTSLSGIDPFAPPDPTDPAILQLIALLQSLKERSLKTSSALYLIWNYDLSGKSAPDPAQVTEFARTLRGDFVAIEDQFAATEDPGGDIARARMTLVYGQEAADAFFALLDDTLTVDVAYTHSAPALEAAIKAADSKISYDDFRHRLLHSGLLTEAMQTSLKNVTGVSVDFKNAVDELFARSEDIKGSFFARYPELKPLYDAYLASTDPVDQKRKALLAAFRPELSRRRKRQHALQRLSAAAGIDLAYAKTLIDPDTAPYPLRSTLQTGGPSLDDVLFMEMAGVTATFYYRDTATGVVGRRDFFAANLNYASGSSNPLPANPTPGAAISGIWSGEIEIPETGFYNFVIETETGATVSLSLDGQPRPLTRNGKVYRNTDPLELKAGTLYDFELKVEKIKARLSVKWETPKRSREVIPARYLYQPLLLMVFTDIYTRFLKVVSLATGLGLTANEIAHFATDPDYHILAEGWLNSLRVIGGPAVGAAELLKPLRDLLDYARIKSEVAPGDESLLTILKDPVTATANADGLFFKLIPWDKTSLEELLAHFGGSIADLTHFDQFRRVYVAFELIRKIGISANALTRATTNEPTGDTLRDLQAALRARYAADDWRGVVQPINDVMRGVQRNALVAYILHHLRSNPDTSHIDTADKLFEYFLMDVQMEPCMQTSRVRHALSSIQLFIDRSLMNLEPRVSPASINAKQWEWMKRYRVWEANRKVFLFPENWLEPELRDDKSPFFKELESELLQSDITDDAAATALLNYLSKLEEVAKLEACGIYHTPADPVQRTGEIDHVIARTAGAHRKYYYRRYEYGYWTPWEQIKLDIEDNPVAPVVWNGRLLLFWLRILKQAPPDLQNPFNGTGPLMALNTNDINLDRPQMEAQAVLCWSEYYNGKWQPTKTSDVDHPAALGSFVHMGFSRSLVDLSAVEEGDILQIGLGSAGSPAFLLYNTHSVPEVSSSTYPGANRSMITADHRPIVGFNISYFFEDRSIPPLRRQVLRPPINSHTIYYTIVPDNTNNQLQNDWDAPFFFADSRHVFLVRTTKEAVLIGAFSDYSRGGNFNSLEVVNISPLGLPTDQRIRVAPNSLEDGGLIRPDTGLITRTKI